MKLKYHLFFLIIFIQDILCFQYEDYIKSFPEAFHSAKGDSKKDEIRKEKNKDENDNNKSNSNYKVGMKDIANNISNEISDDNKNENNNSYDKYDCNDDDKNTSNNLFHKMMCAFKNKLFKNEKVIEKDIRNVKKGVIDLKENVVKDSSNINKHTNILKDDITKNTNYLFNLFKKSFNEETEHVNKFSADNLNKLNNLTDSHLFFSKLLLTLSQKDDKDKNKITHINNYSNNIMNNETENNTNLLQNFLSFIKNFKHKDQYNNDINIKKENDFFHSLYVHNQKDKNNNITDKKYSWWFTNKHDEKKNVDNHLNLLYNNSNNSFYSTLNQNQTDHENLPEQVREKNSQEDKKKWFDIFLKYFYKNEEKIEKEMNEKKDMNDNNKNNVNVDDHNYIGLHNIDDKKNKFSFLNYWNDKHEKNDKDILKEGPADEHSQDNNNNNKRDDQKNDDNKKFNIFMYFRKNNKYEEDINKNKREMNMNMNMTDDKKVGDDTSNDTTVDTSNDTTVDTSNDTNVDTSNYTNVDTSNYTNVETSNDTNVVMSNNLNNNVNKDEMDKVDDESKGFALNLIKNYYDNNKNVDNINYSLLLTSDKETNENINYHPLIKFKSCLMNCFKEINNKEKSVENESYLSLDDYKILEKCISKCKNNNLNDTHSKDSMKKDDTILYIEKNNIHDTIKNNLLNDNINNLINDNNQVTEKETSSKWTNFFYKKNNKKNRKDNYEENKNSNNLQENNSVFTSNETDLENLNVFNDNLSTHLMYDIDNNNNNNNNNNNSNSNSNYHNYKMKNLLIDSKFKYSNKEKKNNFIQDEQQDKNKNIYNKPFKFFNYFNYSNINTDDNNIYNDNLTMNNSVNDNLSNNYDKYNNLKNINNNNIILNKNDIDNDENNNYISTGFFLFLLLVTFFVYLSAFTNIINQFYLSFKEKICLFIKGKYKGTFDNVYEESCESFLPKVQYKNCYNNNNDNNHFRQSYENIYHSFQENSFDMA
ncbi:conserved Plasmodium protein, unknown function [Plasmodium sp. gorilla clade G3]|nr:conserved Plasmodium protein, unknown function [Plasmodium sp. gorilla clade G3]